MRKLTRRPYVKNLWLLTGTPAPNGLMDIWSQIYLLDGGLRLGKNITTYRSRYFYPGRQLPTTGVVVRWDLKEHAEERIHEKLEDIALGMKSEYYLTLPDITYNDVKFQLSPAMMKSYREFKRNLVVDLEILGGEVHTAANAAVVTSKLCQIASGGIYVDDADLRGGEYKILHEKKLDILEEIQEGIGHSPMLVFYEYKFELAQLQKRFPDGKTINDKNVIEDWDAGKVPMLFAHPASASMGLNLQVGGSHVVWLTPTWNLEYYEQGNKRVHRQGQKADKVVIHHIIAEGTMDEVKMEVLSGKADVQDALTRHLESPI
jgi:SNF2 family DNA or RNA helicase